MFGGVARWSLREWLRARWGRGQFGSAGLGGVVRRYMGAWPVCVLRAWPSDGAAGGRFTWKRCSDHEGLVHEKTRTGEKIKRRKR